MFTTPSSLPICTRPPDDLTACVVAIGPRRLLLHSAHCSASVECCCFHMDGMRFSFSRCVSVSVCGASTYAWKRTARVRTSTSVLMSSTHYICNFIKDVCSVILIFNQQQKKINMEKKHTHIEKCSIFLTCINIDDVESWTGYYFFILKRDITLMVYLTSSSSLLIYLNLLFFFHLSSPLRSTFLFNRVSWI